MYKIDNKKLLVEYEETKLICGDLAFSIDKSTGVSITCCPQKGLSLRLYARTRESGKFYCRIVKTVEVPEDHIRQHIFNTLVHKGNDFDETRKNFNQIAELLGLTKLDEGKQNE